MATVVEPRSTAAEAGPRYGWVWTVIPADARRVEVLDDPELAAFLRAANFAEIGEGMRAKQAADAVLVGPGRRTDIDAAARRLTDGGVLALRFESAPRAGRVRPLRGAGRLLAGRSTRRRSKHAADALRALGLTPRSVATGKPSSAHPLWRDGSTRSPAQVIVAGSRGEPARTPLDVAVERAEDALGYGLTPYSVSVRGSGVLLVAAAAAGRGERLIRLAAGPASALLRTALANLRALEEAAPEAVRARLVLPCAETSLGFGCLTVEPRASGRSPRRLRSGLQAEVLDFLVALRSSGSATAIASDALLVEAAALTPHLPAEDRAALEAAARAHGGRLAGLDGAWAHGDFWPGNLLAHGDRLTAVLDWDAAQEAGLPLLDLFHLIVMGRPRLRRLPHGRRCTDFLWPLARRGGDRLVRDYCEATRTPADRATLEALAFAYWITRVARDLRTFADRPGRRRWMDENLRLPLARLTED